MHRRTLLAVVGTGSLAGCTSIIEGETGSAEVTDTDGDGVVDASDYAPRDPDVQQRDDLHDEVYSAGVLRIRQTFRADLDTGTESSFNDEVDLWFEADSAVDRFLTPQNDCTLAVAGPRPVGRSGCAEADLQEERLRVDDILERYVCAQTSEGRYAEFLVVDVQDSPGAATLAYTTWAN